ncbi:MHYT domain-containing protein [Phenylobacterium sp.]|uniref:sensor histidine kinase n=1 Tax=Phenylobacterium sp. TaxID=1871053 RepID=UPI002C1D4AAA|nr:MHYT domain-containing protein [Phenylobacterium sp.]HLZ75309.1 MHYT domain-containing protein [Phenylobacterium sp.]
MSWPFAGPMTVLGLCFDGSAHGIAVHHDRVLVFVSFLIAVLASFTALEMAERLRGAAGPSRWLWHGAGAVALGGGIWSMHFVAMLAYEIPVSHGYDATSTVLSGLVAIVAVALGLRAFEKDITLPRILGAGLLVGLGIVIMHYCGMSALRLPGAIYYRPDLFALSAVIAVGAATVALWLAHILRSTLQRAGAALVMALAVCGMHYTGMAATILVAAGPVVEAPAGVVRAETLGAAVTLSVMVILGLGLVCTLVDRRFEARAAREAERLRDLNTALAEQTERLTSALAEVDDARRAEAATKARTELLSSMSHELRTPLNAVLGFAQVMRLNQAREPLTPRQQDAVDRIISNADDLLALIVAMLDLARLDRGEGSFSRGGLDVADLLADLTDEFIPAADQAQVSLKLEMDAAVPCVAFADRTRLRQALSSIISNAIKYNRPGGDVRIVARARQGQIEVAVRDTGDGIPAALLPRLFDAFDRLGREGGSILGGGIGLAVSKRVIEAMEGELWVESAEGLGSTFTVTVPASPRAPRADTAEICAA